MSSSSDNLAPCIDARGLSRKIGEQTLLADANLTLFPGNRLGVTGPTGSGKSVLLRALALLDPMDSGVIEWAGSLVQGNGILAYRSNVIYLHQQVSFLDVTVEEVLRQPFQLKIHSEKKFNRNRVMELLNRLGRNEDFLSKQTRDLSGGEAQITALVRAIQLDPQILLLDESTSALDSSTVSKVDEWLLDWIEEKVGHRAFVWVSHDHKQMERVSNRQIKMNVGGKLVAG